MVNEEILIEYDKLGLDNIFRNAKFIAIKKGRKIKKYKVVDNEEEVLNYSLNHVDYSENKDGIIVTCECNNIVGTFNNTIFLKKFKVDSYSDLDISDPLYLVFNKCEFFEDIELLGADYKRIKINNSILRSNLYIRFINCEKLRADNIIMKENIIVENSEIGKFIINIAKFEENLLFQEVNIQSDFTMDKIKGRKDLCFIDCRFDGLSKLELEVNGELNFSQCSFYKKSEINFDEIDGKFSLYKTNFSDRCYLEYELLENKKYKPLIFEDDYKKTKWNFLTVADIYKSSGRTEQYLETFYLFKKYERLERKNKDNYKFSLLDYLIGITTKYYTCWKRTLLSMVCIISVFFILYCSFPNLLMYKDVPISSKSLFITVFEMYKSSNYDLNFLISKFGNALYFTIVTFTTVGYGDITPLNWMKMAVSFESFLGIFFTSSFVVALSRRFL